MTENNAAQAAEHIETLERMRADYNPSDGPMSAMKAAALDAALSKLRAEGVQAGDERAIHPEIQAVLAMLDVPVLGYLGSHSGKLIASADKADSFESAIPLVSESAHRTACEKIIAALASAHVAGAVQWPTMPASKGQSPVLFEDGYAEGWAKCMDECQRAVSLASAPVADNTGEKPAGFANCPITGMKFWGNIEHPTLGTVATYGGPFDTYTIPALCDDGELRSEHFDQDAGQWVEGGRPIGWAYNDQQDMRPMQVSAPVAGEARITNAQAADFADKHGMYYDMDQAIAGNHARALLAAYAAPQASEAVRNQALDDAEEAVVTLYESDEPVYLPDIALAIRALKTQADKDGGDCAKGAVVPSEPLRVFSAGMWTYDGTGQAFSHTELDEAAFVTYRAALSAQPGAQKTGGGDAG